MPSNRTCYPHQEPGTLSACHLITTFANFASFFPLSSFCCFWLPLDSSFTLNIGIRQYGGSVGGPLLRFISSFLQYIEKARKKSHIFRIISKIKTTAYATRKKVRIWHIAHVKKRRMYVERKKEKWRITRESGPEFATNSMLCVCRIRHFWAVLRIST